MPITRQIAETLEYAHERGVIRRNLKSKNVKITPECTVKVLDFGLAKVLDAQDSTSTMDHSSLFASPRASGSLAFPGPKVEASYAYVSSQIEMWLKGDPRDES